VHVCVRVCVCVCARMLKKKKAGDVCATSVFMFFCVHECVYVRSCMRILSYAL
jgi:hypothetical protein